MAEPPELIMEMRHEDMVSLKGGKPTSKPCHFIKPVVSLGGKIPERPAISIPFRPIISNCTLSGWRNPTQQWVSWVDLLHSSYKAIWKRAGIYNAILASRYKVVKNQDLFFGLAERWCCETNTFVFPWGEATVTLEDVIILGGYSVLGDSVYGQSGNGKEVAFIEEKLLKVYEKKPNQEAWMKHFNRSESEIEHEAFLALWLSRFVLPTYPYDSIVKRFFKIAICLARGVEIALAPIVLASLYKDLSLLKSIQSGTKVEKCGKVGILDDDVYMVTLWAPLQLVQVWAWERFPQFRPKPRTIAFGEPRMGRWHEVNEEEIGNVRPMLQAAGDSFVWRPYCVGVVNWPMPDCYIETDRWFLMDEYLSEDVKAMALCLRVTELVGTDSIEQYNPHRVAMQFGFDQDVPQSVRRGLLGFGIRRKDLLKLAWVSYMEPLRETLVYLPSKSYEPLVTVRYLKWIRDGSLTHRTALEGVVKKSRCRKRVRRLESPRLLFDLDDDEASEAIGHEADVQPEFEALLGSPPKGSGARNRADAPPRSGRKNFTVDGTDVPSCFGLEDDEMEEPFVIIPRLVADRQRNVRPKLEPMFGGVHLDVPPGLPPKVHGIKKNDAKAPPGFAPRNVSGPDIDVPPGFLPKKVDARLGFVLETVADNAIDVPPGFVPKKVGNKIDDPPSSVRKTVAEHAIDLPLGVKARKVGNSPDVPPGFQPKSTAPKKPDSPTQLGSGFQMVKVKKERVESKGNSESLLRSGFQTDHNTFAADIVSRVVQNARTVTEKCSGKRNDSVQGTGGECKLANREIAATVSHGRGVETNSGTQGSSSSTRMELEARVRQLEKQIAALRESK